MNQRVNSHFCHKGATQYQSFEERLRLEEDLLTVQVKQLYLCHTGSDSYVSN